MTTLAPATNTTVFALRAGLARGWIELRHVYTSAREVANSLSFSVVMLVVMIFLRNSPVAGSPLSLGSLTLPGALGLNVASGGMFLLTQLITIEREDGTLLRARAIPGGLLGYFVGKVMLVAGTTVVTDLVLLVPGLFLFDGVGRGGTAATLTLVWVLLLGMAATMPIGAILGSLFSSPRRGSLVMLPFLALTATSGIFYPITHFPQWLQAIAQVFPMYWLGLGMRSALLPGTMSAVEIDGSWRHLETLGVLGAWAALGLAVAPVVLRGMARRESGSSMRTRQQRAMRRVG